MMQTLLIVWADIEQLPLLRRGICVYQHLEFPNTLFHADKCSTAER